MWSRSGPKRPRRWERAFCPWGLGKPRLGIDRRRETRACPLPCRGTFETGPILRSSRLVWAFEGRLVAALRSLLYCGMLDFGLGPSPTSLGYFLFKQNISYLGYSNIENNRILELLIKLDSAKIYAILELSEKYFVDIS